MMIRIFCIFPFMCEKMAKNFTHYVFSWQYCSSTPIPIYIPMQLFTHHLSRIVSFIFHTMWKLTPPRKSCTFAHHITLPPHNIAGMQWKTHCMLNIEKKIFVPLLAKIYIFSSHINLQATSCNILETCKCYLNTTPNI